MGEPEWTAVRAKYWAWTDVVKAASEARAMAVFMVAVVTRGLGDGLEVVGDGDVIGSWWIAESELEGVVSVAGCIEEVKRKRPVEYSTLVRWQVRTEYATFPVPCRTVAPSLVEMLHSFGSGERAYRTTSIRDKELSRDHPPAQASGAQVT